MGRDSNLHATRAEIQGTSWLAGNIGVATRAAAITAGLEDMGNYLGFEIKAEAEKEPVLKAVRGVVSKSGHTGGMVSLGYEFTTREVADSRKFRLALQGSSADPFTQAALAGVDATDLVFTAQVPSKAGYWYPLFYQGSHVHALTSVTIAGKVEGTDFVVDLKLGLIRFLVAQTADVTCVITGPAIDSAHADYLIGVQPRNQVVYSGYWSVAAFDQDPDNNLVMRHEFFSGDLTVTQWPKIDHTGQSELKFQIDITHDNPVAFHRD